MKLGTCRVGLGLALLTSACSSPARSPVAAAKDIFLRSDTTRVIEARVPSHATLDTLLKQYAVSSKLAEAAIAAVRGVFNPRALRANQPYRITLGVDGLIREFQYEIDPERLLRVIFGERAQASIVTSPKTVELDTVAAEITKTDSSLVAALDRQGETVALALRLAEVFGGEVDFNADLQPGDHFDVLVEREKLHGETIGYGQIRAAVLVNDKRRLTAIRYEGADGIAGWYDETGRSLKRQFLRSPLLFDPRITSRFSYRRLHPVTGAVRAHLGVDYAAPYGAPVVAVAAGVVVEAGVSGEAGRIVRIRHTGGYETAYLHLSGFAAGIRAGARVAQGDVIGRVGASGLVTGTHLDYRIRKNGVYVNPLAEVSRMPKGEPLAASAIETFAAERDRWLARLPNALAAKPTGIR